MLSLYTPCARRVCRLREGGMRGHLRERPTHHDEREGAARVDRNATRVPELGADADVVEEAKGAGAGERGGCPGGDVDTANEMIVIILRCIMCGRTHTERKSS